MFALILIIIISIIASFAGIAAGERLAKLVIGRYAR